MGFVAKQENLCLVLFCFRSHFKRSDAAQLRMSANMASTCYISQLDQRGLAYQNKRALKTQSLGFNWGQAACSSSRHLLTVYNINITSFNVPTVNIMFVPV